MSVPKKIVSCTELIGYYWHIMSVRIRVAILGSVIQLLGVAVTRNPGAQHPSAKKNLRKCYGALPWISLTWNKTRTILGELPRFFPTFSSYYHRCSVVINCPEAALAMRFGNAHHVETEPRTGDTMTRWLCWSQNEAPEGKWSAKHWMIFK